MEVKNGRWFFNGFNMGPSDEIVNNQFGYSTGKTVEYWILKECLFVSENGQPYVSEGGEMIEKTPYPWE